MYDEISGKGAAVDLAPLNLEAVLSTIHRDSRMLHGYIFAALVNTAKRLVPDFVVSEKPRHPLAEPYHLEEPPEGERRKPLSRWIRRLAGNEESGDADEGQGLAEYALILALVAIVAIVALVFLGDAIASALSDVGQSV